MRGCTIRGFLGLLISDDVCVAPVHTSTSIKSGRMRDFRGRTTLCGTSYVTLGRVFFHGWVEWDIRWLVSNVDRCYVLPSTSLYCISIVHLFVNLSLICS